jgi:serpin B
MKFLRILLIASIFLSCGSTKKATKPDTSEIEELQMEIAINKFGFNLYNQISQQGKNTFFSPISISSAMAMAYLGADGETKNEFQQVLHFKDNKPEFHENFKKLNDEIVSSDSINLFHIANSIWLQKDFQLRTDYSDGLNSYYSGNFFAVDFSDNGNREQARNNINKWVSNETNDKIKNIIPNGVLTSQTRTVLVNAVYFLSEWKKSFRAERNTQANFYTGDSKIISSTFMNNSQSIAYYEDEKLQCVEIPYKGNKYSLFIALTKDKKPGDWYKEHFTYNYLQKVQDEFKNAKVDVSIPKFKMETSYELIPFLQSMGMKEAFTDRANFSKMRDENDLKITDVLHKAFVEVNEKGTEAAASTAVVMSVKSAAIIEWKKFIADHPFMFMILDKETNTILFMGELNRP